MKNGELAAQNMDLAKGLAMHAYRRLKGKTETHVEISDLEGAAIDGLIQAAQTYNRSEVPFGSWARLKIRYAITDWLRKHGPMVSGRNHQGKPRAGIQQLYFEGDGSERREPFMTMNETPFDISSLFGVLTVKQKAEVLMRVVYGMTDREANHVKGYNPESTAGRLNYSIARRKMRCLLESRGITKLSEVL